MLRYEALTSTMLRMRVHGDHRRDTDLKTVCDGARGPKPDLVFEDRDQAVKMWRDAGVPCFSSCPGKLLTPTPLTFTDDPCIIRGMSASNPTSETVKLSINLFPEEVHAVAKMRAAALRKTLREYFTWLVLEDAARTPESEIYKV